MKNLKPYLKYHRIVTLCIVFTLIAITYNYTSSPNTYENGQLKSFGNRKGGLNIGHWEWYYPSGKMQMEGDFVDGKRVGLWILYRENGNRISESKYENDQMNGIQILYDNNGKEIKRQNFIKDVLINP